MEQIAQIGFVTSIRGGLQDLTDKTLSNLVWIHCDPALSRRLGKKGPRSHFLPERVVINATHTAIVFR